MRFGRLAAAFLAAIVLVGCGPSARTPTPDASASRVRACQDAVPMVVAAVQRFVDTYNPAETATATPSPAATSTATPADTSTATPGAGESDIRQAVAQATQVLRDNGCDSKVFSSELSAALLGVDARGPIATAVARRIAASLTGKMGSAAVTVTLGANDDIAQAIAVAPAGSTLNLPGGRLRLTQSLVILDSVTLQGTGSGLTVIESAAPDVSVFVLAGNYVALVGLTIARDPGVPGSAVLAGTEAVLRLSGVTLSGARAGEDKLGGAGVQLAGQGDAASARGTTLEVTDSTFTDNSWAGIAVASGHRVSVRTSTFTSNGACGICFLGASDGSVKDSTLSQNAVGFAVAGTAAPTLASNVISAGQIGIQATDQARPILDGNKISGAAKAAVYFAGTSSGAIQNTTCTSVPYGIVISNSAAPTLGANACKIARGAGG